MHDTKLKIFRDANGNSGIDTARPRSDTELNAIAREFKLHVPGGVHDMSLAPKNLNGGAHATNAEHDRLALDIVEMFDRELAGVRTRGSMSLGVAGSKAVMVDLEQTKSGSYRISIPAAAVGNDQDIVAAVSRRGYIAAATVGGEDTSKLDAVRDAVGRVIERSISLFRNKDLAGT